MCKQTNPDTFSHVYSQPAPITTIHPSSMLLYMHTLQLPHCTLPSSTHRCSHPTALYAPKHSLWQMHAPSLPWHHTTLRISLGARAPAQPHAATAPDKAPTRWQVLRIPGDGRCLFRSLAQGRALQRSGSLLGSRDETAEADALRHAVCRKLREQRDMISPFIDGDFDAYVDRMQHPSTWGGEPELAVAADCVQSQVDVYVPVWTRSDSNIAYRQ